MTGIAIPRPDAKGNIPARAVIDFCTQVMQQLKQLQDTLNTPTGVTVQDALNNLLKQPDGVVVKISGTLLTAPITAASGLALAPKTGSGNTAAQGVLTVPLLAGVAAGSDGLLAKTGSGALQPRTLQVASGSTITIDNPDGAGGDPTFHAP
jgi:hypothetical protein